MVICGWCGQLTEGIACTNCGKDPWWIWRELRKERVSGETGATGPQGPIGPAGPTGAQGPQGDTGAQGEQGPQGATGAAGNPGATGSQGPQGDPGSAGATGGQGPTGPEGPEGDVGLTGNTGNAGIQGIPGNAGAQGNPGADSTVPGPQGIQGTQGPPGTFSPVYAALGATLALALGTNDVVKATPTATGTFTTTVPTSGRLRVVIVLQSNTTAKTMTFGTGFKPTATLVLGTVASRVFCVSFVSDGVALYETARTVAMVA